MVQSGSGKKKIAKIWGYIFALWSVISSVDLTAGLHTVARFCHKGLRDFVGGRGFHRRISSRDYVALRHEVLLRDCHRGVQCGKFISFSISTCDFTGGSNHGIAWRFREIFRKSGNGRAPPDRGISSNAGFRHFVGFHQSEWFHGIAWFFDPRKLYFPGAHQNAK